MTENATLLAKILIERYGLDGLPPRSIAEVAKRHGVMRETVRSFEGKLLERIKPVLLKELRECGPAS